MYRNQSGEYTPRYKQAYLVGISPFNDVINVYMRPVRSVCTSNYAQAKPCWVPYLNTLQFTRMIKRGRRTRWMPVSWQARIISDLWRNTLLFHSQVTVTIEFWRPLFWGSLWGKGCTVEVACILLCSVCCCWKLLKTGVVRGRFICPCKQ